MRAANRFRLVLDALLLLVSQLVDMALTLRDRLLILLEPFFPVLAGLVFVGMAFEFAQNEQRAWLLGDMHIHSHWSPGYDRTQNPPKPIFGGRPTGLPVRTRKELICPGVNGTFNGVRLRNIIFVETTSDSLVTRHTLRVTGAPGTAPLSKLEQQLKLNEPALVITSSQEIEGRIVDYHADLTGYDITIEAK